MNNRMELDADGLRFENRKTLLAPICMVSYLSWSITREVNRTYINFTDYAITCIESNPSEEYFTL
jgi:hypothetical protein